MCWVLSVQGCANIVPLYSPLVHRIAGEGAAAWEIHSQALAAKARGEDVIVLSVGDPDLDTPAAITERAIAELRAGNTHYTPCLGENDLRDTLAAHYTRQFGWEVGRGHVAVVSGAQNGLYMACQLTLAPGDEVIALDPMYVTYEATIRASGAHSVVVAPRAGGAFRPDLDAIAAAITPRTRALMLTTPNNPTGVTLGADELACLAEIAQRHDLWVIADEVYGALVFDGAHLSIASLPGMAERTITVASLSKSHAMTGWRVGWIIAPTEMIAHVDNLALCMLYGLPGYAQAAGVVALTEAWGEVDRMRAIYRQRRDHLVAALTGVPGLRPLTPDAGMFLMVDVTGTGLSSGDFARGLLRAVGVSVLDASAFGASAVGHVRISFTLGLETLSEAARRIARYCAQLSANAPEAAHG